jgi:hypothetical protein
MKRKINQIMLTNYTCAGKALGYLWSYPVKCTFVGQTVFPLPLRGRFG